MATKSLLDELPNIAIEGKCKAAQIIERLDNSHRIDLLRRYYHEAY